MQHLGMLLAAPDQAVVTATLQTLMAAARKVHSPGARFSVDAALNKRLQSLASGWGGKEQVGHAAWAGRGLADHIMQLA